MNLKFTFWTFYHFLTMQKIFTLMTFGRPIYEAIKLTFFHKNDLFNCVLVSVVGTGIQHATGVRFKFQ